MKRRVKAVRLVRVKEVPVTKCYGYDIDALVCLAEALRLNGVTANDLNTFKLNLEFAVDAAFNAKYELYKNAAEDYVMRMSTNFDRMRDSHLFDDLIDLADMTTPCEYFNSDEMKLTVTNTPKEDTEC